MTWYDHIYILETGKLIIKNKSQNSLNIVNNNITLSVTTLKQSKGTGNKTSYFVSIKDNNTVKSVVYISTFTKQFSNKTSLFEFNSSVIYTKDGLHNLTYKYYYKNLNNTNHSIVLAISGSIGWSGWALSFSPSNMKGLAYQLYSLPSSGVYGTIVAYIIQYGIEGSVAGPLGTVAGLVADVIVGLEFLYIFNYDISHGNHGVWFAFVLPSLIPIDWGLNPVPWYY